MAAVFPESFVDPMLLPTRPDYADPALDVSEYLNFGGILDWLKVPDGVYLAFYFFRSKIRLGFDRSILAAPDKKAWDAAKEAEGYIHYQPTDDSSWCAWRNTILAALAINTPEHREAAGYAPLAYEHYEVVHRLIGRSAIDGQVEIIKPNTARYDYVNRQMCNT